MSESLTIDPRIFIHPPYERCPQCRQQSYGVLTIAKNSYSRRCRECWRTAHYGLPDLTKKIIYLDQFVISNMMKALNEAVGGHEGAALDPFWLTLFSALERVSKLQLAICPHSDGHQTESRLSPFPVELKRMYEQLSHNVGFLSVEQIAHRQVTLAAGAWLRGEQPTLDFDPARVTHGDLHGWQDRFIISVTANEPKEWTDGIRRERQQAHQSLTEVFQHFRSQPGVSFAEWLRRELDSGGDAVIEAYRRHMAQWRQTIASGQMPGLDLVMGGSRGAVLFRDLKSCFEYLNLPNVEILGRVIGFLKSDGYKNVPANRISALLWASLAHQASCGGRKKPPSRGMSSDVDVISALLPYCDAMFVDKECHTFLHDLPKAYRLPYPTRVFSLNNKQAFLDYLHDLEANADFIHLSEVRRLYGEDWPRPSLKMYKPRTGPSLDSKRPSGD